jgi:Holliday junction resolvase-like predicted endonuclease
MKWYVSILLIIVGGFLGIWSLRFHKRIILRHRREKARIYEKKAIDLLKKYGFDILDVQKGASYFIFINGRPKEIKVRADVIVKKGGKVYVAEVKSGKTSPSADIPATRRQLLEYYLVYKPAGILLVDMEQQKIKTIEYSFLKKDYDKLRYIFYVLGIFFVGFLLGFLTRGE